MGWDGMGDEGREMGYRAAFVGKEWGRWREQVRGRYVECIGRQAWKLRKIGRAARIQISGNTRRIAGGIDDAADVARRMIRCVRSILGGMVYDTAITSQLLSQTTTFVRRDWYSMTSSRATLDLVHV